MIGRASWTLLMALCLGLLCLAVWRSCTRQTGLPAPTSLAERRLSPLAFSRSCQAPTALAGAAVENARTEATAAWSVFGRSETGWAIYEPLVAHEVRTPCPANTTAFAAALADWQATRRLPGAGVMNAPTLDALRLVWLGRRPFVAQSAHGACPPPPPANSLVAVRPGESYESKPIQLEPQVLAAWRAMTTAARAESPAVAADPRLLTIISGYRDPVADAVRCALSEACGAITQALCSAHRTGLAMDLYLGSAPGYSPASSADANRLYQSRSPAYLWLVANASRFGFVNYPFEPWHWEWTGRNQ